MRSSASLYGVIKEGSPYGLDIQTKIKNKIINSPSYS